MILIVPVKTKPLTRVIHAGPNRTAFLIVALLALYLPLALLTACDSQRPPPESDVLQSIVIETSFGEMARLRVEVADTESELARGLSYREDLPSDQGMLLVVGDSQPGFWMRDTSIPLSVAFISTDGTILDIQDMEPFSTRIHNIDEPYFFALEVNQRWFQEHNVAPGDLVRLPESVADNRR